MRQRAHGFEARDVFGVHELKSFGRCVDHDVTFARRDLHIVRVPDFEFLPVGNTDAEGFEGDSRQK